MGALFHVRRCCVHFPFLPLTGGKKIIMKLTSRGAAAAMRGVTPVQLLCIRRLRTDPPGKVIQDEHGGGSLQELCGAFDERRMCLACGENRIITAQAASVDKKRGGAAKTFAQNAQTLGLGALARQPPKSMVFP